MGRIISEQIVMDEAENAVTQNPLSDWWRYDVYQIAIMKEKANIYRNNN